VTISWQSSGSQEAGQKSKTTTLDFTRTDVVLFGDLTEKAPCNKGPGGKRVQENWLLLNDYLLQAQE